ncbi:carotenoid oxygenase family protein [Sorangium sp. Soce836]|uniref:carotenoid oxygenase family protein n=1 Tax=Sorangium TaxID=39643 RepID=UPI0038B45D8D
MRPYGLRTSRVPALWRQGLDDVSGGLPSLHRLNLHLPTGTVTEARLDDLPSEYPRIADAEVGRPSRYGYATDVSWEREANHGEIYEYDLRCGAARTVHRFPAGYTGGEPIFVPGARRGAADTGDEGYLMTFAHDRGRGTSYLAILDAANVEADAIAEVHLPGPRPRGVPRQLSARLVGARRTHHPAGRRGAGAGRAQPRSAWVGGAVGRGGTGAGRAQPRSAWAGRSVGAGRAQPRSAWAGRSVGAGRAQPRSVWVGDEAG